GCVHPAQIGNLEAIIRGSRDQGQAVAVVKDMLEVSKSVALLRVVMQRSGASVRRLDAEIVADEVSGDKVSVVTAAASIVEARLDRVVAPAVQRDLPARLQGAAFGLQIDDAGAAQPVLRRQAPGN